MSSFVHLHTHSHYSLLNALPLIPELVDAAVRDGMDALALTDAGNLYGAIEFYEACKKADIKPIIGVDFYVALRTRHDKEPRIDNKRHRLVLLAEEYAGYKNLIKLVTESNLTGFYYKPRIDRELMERYSEGLIAILPSFSSEVSDLLKQENEDKAREILAQYKNWYGTANVFLEITHHPEIGGHPLLMDRVKAIAKDTKTPLVAAHDVYYLRPEDRVARETLMKIQGGAPGGGFTDEEEDFSFITQAQAGEYFRDTPEALQHTIEIAERCNLEIPMEWTFPNFIIESGRTADDELHDTAYEGVAWRGLSLDDPVVKERLDYELGVIKMKGYAVYFLVVGDLLREARERGILTTIRGSVAGSLATYVLGITNVNPLEYNLPFERFLNPERPSAPDIDMDFADDRRDEIIDYARQKYGRDNVAQIGTFGTMMARACVRDVARALGHSYAIGDQIAKLIPMGSQGKPMYIDLALELVPELAQLEKKDATVREILMLGRKIEGHARHIGVHAAGVVIAPKPLTEYVPLQYDPKTIEKGEGKLITQYDMHAVGEDGVGLLKFDFLGIKNLAILADAVKRVKHERNIDIDIESIPIDDKKTFALLACGETMGLFQLNGAGMTRYLKELKPSTIHDINAMVALYRPGPMESIPSYIERKNNPHLVNYLDPRLKEILERSYGVITYQDDVMMTAIKLAGYSWLEADKLRKAMGKKIPAVMAAEKDKLMQGLAENGMNKHKAEQLWSLIEPFAAYGFNKAHAASYGRVAYQTAYMKANFTVEYMAAILTADSGDVEKVALAIHECERLGIQVLPPDVNESDGGFTVVTTQADDAHAEVSGEKAIRFGLYTIKNFGEGIGSAIIEERTKGGKFTSVSNFLTRITDRNLNKKSLESLIKAGALDNLEDRARMFRNLDIMLQYNKEAATQDGMQDSLFGALGTAMSDLALPEVEPVSDRERLAWERELLGLYLSGHPLDRFEAQLTKHNFSIAKAHDARPGTAVVIYAIVEGTKTILTKKGDTMAFLTLADKTGSIEAVCFADMYAEHRETLASDACVGIKGRLTERGGEKSIVVEKVKILS